MRRYSLGVLGLLMLALAPARASDDVKPIVLGGSDWSPSFVVFTPDGKTLLTWDGQGVLKAFTVATGKEDAALAKLGTTGKARGVSADGKTVYLSDQFGGNGAILDLESLKLRKAPGSTSAMQTAVSSDGGRIAWLLAPYIVNGSVLVWDAAQDKPLKPALALPLDGGFPYSRPVPVLGVAMSADGKLLATGHPHGPGRAKISVWDLDTGKERAALLLDDADAGLLQFTADGTTLVSTSGLQFGTGTVRTWDVATGKLRTLLGGRGKRVFAVALTADGKWLATGDEAEGTIRVYAVASGNSPPVATFRSEHGDSVAGLAFSPDGRWLASVYTGGRGVRLWDVARVRDQKSR
jgi:WD40 repeat protein